MGSIGDVFLRMVADGTGFQADVVRKAGVAGDAAGKTMGQRMGQQLRGTLGRSIATGAGAVFGAGFAIAAKGAAELDAATQQLVADTGLVGPAAEEAKGQLASMYRDNLQGFDQISQALSKVHTDLGLTGKEAGDTTELFLKFSTATGQDAAGAVAQADDTLDAWNLTAADARPLLDKLIASHQKYGGVISENEAALASLAPPLLALGANLDDGIGLLNLFQTAGIDASKATAALNKAVKGLKPGQTLDDLIKQISSIEDPTLRAQEAIKVFGARGGVALANALKPGINSLKDFVPAAEDVAGATERAGDAVESSFGNQFKLILKNAGGALAEFGNNFGPLLLVAGQFGPKMIAGISAGFGAIVGKLFPNLVARILPSAIAAGTAEGVAMGEAAAVAAVAAETTGVVAGQAAVGAAAVPAAAAAGTAIGGAMAAAIAAITLVAIPVAIAAALALALKSALEMAPDVVPTEAGGTQGQIFSRGHGFGPRSGHGRSGPVPPESPEDRQVRNDLNKLARASVDDQRRGERESQTLTSIDAVLTATQQQVHNDLLASISALDKQGVVIKDALAGVVAGIKGGAGGANETKALVTDLMARRDAALAAGDKATAALFTNAIKQIEPFAKGRQWQQEQLARADKIVASNRTTAAKVADLKTIESQLLAHHRTTAAAAIQKQIDTITAINKTTDAVKGIPVINAATGFTTSHTPAPTPKPGAPKPGPTSNKLGPIPGVHAAGGIALAGIPALFGERGPELAVPRVSARVHTAAQTRDLLGQPAGSTFNMPVTVQGLIRARDPFELSTQMKRLSSFVALTPKVEPA